MKTLFLLILILLASPRSATAQCAGDCDGGGSVGFDEMMHGIEAVLTDQELASCGSLDLDASGGATIDELVVAVGHATRGCAQATATPTPSATPTQAAVTGPQLPEPRPTAAANCGGGYAVAEFRGASTDANSFVGFATPLHLSKVEGAIAFLTPTLITLGGSAVTCPNSLDRAVRLLTFTIGGITTEPRVGSIYALKPGYDFSGPPAPTLAQLDYLERLPTDASAGRGWRAQSGTFTVEAYDGSSMRGRVRAELKAEPNIYPVASIKPAGTVHLDLVLAIDNLVRR